MPFGLRVLKIESVAERFESDVIRPFKIGDRAVKHLGAGLDQPLQTLAMKRVAALEIAMFERAHHGSQELRRSDWLEQIVKRALFYGRDDDRNLGNPGDHHDRGLRLELLQRFEQGQPVTVP